MPETYLLLAALGGNAILAAKLFAFRLQLPAASMLPELPPPLPVRKSAETIAQSKPLPIAKPVQLPPKLPEIERPIDDFKAENWKSSNRQVAPEKAALMLVAFMQKSGAKGYCTHKEIDKWWRGYRDREELTYIDPIIIREQLTALGLHCGRRRVLSRPELYDVYRRTGTERAILYHIPDHPVTARTMDGYGPVSPDKSRTKGGQRPASDEITSKIMRAA